MTKHKDTNYLTHILECIRLIEDFSRGKLATLETQVESWFATTRVLQILAESTMRLSEKTKLAMPEIEWHRIKGFRNILVHDYLGDIDPEVIKSVIEIDLPKLEQAIKKYTEKNHD